MANRKHITGGRVYEETGSRKAILAGRILEETTAGDTTVTGTAPVALVITENQGTITLAITGSGPVALVITTGTGTVTGVSASSSSVGSPQHFPMKSSQFLM